MSKELILKKLKKQHAKLAVCCTELRTLDYDTWIILERAKQILEKAIRFMEGSCHETTKNERN